MYGWFVVAGCGCRLLLLLLLLLRMLVVVVPRALCAKIVWGIQPLVGGCNGIFIFKAMLQ